MTSALPPLPPTFASANASPSVSPPFVWSKRLHTAAVRCALDFVRDHAWIVTGYASVMSLNPHGGPKMVRSLATVVYDAAADIHQAGRALLTHIADTLVTVSNVAAAGRAPLRLDARCLETLGMLIVKVGEDQIATLSVCPLQPTDVLWPAPIEHDGQSWTVLQYTPALLRSHLVAANAFSLVWYLDGFIAERCLWGWNDGLVTSTGFAPTHAPLSDDREDDDDEDNDDDEDDDHNDFVNGKFLWKLAGKWAEALLTLPTLEHLQLPFYLNLSDLQKAHHEAADLHYNEGLEPLQAFCATQRPASFLTLVFLGSPDAFLR